LGAAERLRRELLRHAVVGLDTMVFIYQYEDDPAYAPLTDAVFEAVEAGRVRAVTSTLTLMEVLVKPKRLGRQDLVDDYTYALTTFPNLDMRAVDASIAGEAASMRAKYNLRPPDAVQVAACLVGGADAFITNDDAVKRVKEMRILTLKDFVD
jgi:predicted nucleic acid-binding protein